MKRFLGLLISQLAERRAVRRACSQARGRRPALECLEDRNLLSTSGGWAANSAGFLLRFRPDDAQVVQVSTGGAYTDFVRIRFDLGSYAVEPLVARPGLLVLGAGDYNGDGLLDLATWSNSTLSILLGQTGGTFRASLILPQGPGSRTFSLSTDDWDGDGKPDRVSARAAADIRAGAEALSCGIPGSRFLTRDGSDGKSSARAGRPIPLALARSNGDAMVTGVLTDHLGPVTPALDNQLPADRADTAGDHPEGRTNAPTRPSSGGGGARSPNRIAGRENSERPAATEPATSSSIPAQARLNSSETVTVASSSAPAGGLRAELVSVRVSEANPGLPPPPMDGTNPGLIAVPPPVACSSSPGTTVGNTSFASGSANGKKAPSNDGRLTALVISLDPCVVADLDKAPTPVGSFALGPAGFADTELVWPDNYASDGSGTAGDDRETLLDFGQLLAGALYLGSLRQGDADPLQGAAPGSAQLLVADLVQRGTESFTRLVRSFYELLLGRKPADGEEQGLVNMLLAGQTEEQALSTLLGTAEFYERSLVLAGLGTPDERYIQSLYYLLLRRLPAEAEMSGWLGALPDLGRGGVAAFLLASTEYRALRVDTIYRDLFQRPASAEEAASWAESPFDLLTLRAFLEAHAEQALPA